MPEPFLRWHPVDAPRGAVVVVHGFGEHSGRYEHVCARLSAAGFASLSFDLRGHGSSAGPRTHIERFDDYLDDVAAAVARARERWPEQKLALVGHSLGAVIATAYVLERSGGAGADALALSAPAFAFAVAVPWHRRLLGHVASRVVPTLRRETNVNVFVLSHDPSNALAILQDGGCEPTATARWYTESLRAQRRTLARAGELKLPLCILLPGDDFIVDPEVSRRFFASAGSADKKLFEYPELYHEVFNETERERVLSDLLGWLGPRLR